MNSLQGYRSLMTYLLHTDNKSVRASRRPEDRAAAKREVGALVWVCCQSPVISAGLEQVLRSTYRVHCGQDPPSADTPLFVVLSVEDTQFLPQAMERARRANPDALVVIFGSRLDPALIRAAFQAGARGYIHASHTPKQIIRVLQVVASGSFAVPRQLLEYLIDEMSGRRITDLKNLSDRQREILDLVEKGLSNAQIGKRLFLSESTVKQHLRSAYKLLRVKNRTQAARIAGEKSFGPYRQSSSESLVCANGHQRSETAGPRAV